MKPLRGRFLYFRKSNLENSQAGSSSDDIMNLGSDDRVVLEPGISGNGSRVQSGSQKASNFFHAIGIDSGFGKPEYLTTTIFEENAEDNSAEERDEESIEATNDFEVKKATYFFIGSPGPGLNIHLSLKHLNHRRSILHQEAQIHLNRTELIQMESKMVHPRRKLTKLQLFWKNVLLFNHRVLRNQQ